MKIRTKLEYRCDKYKEFDYVESEWYTKYNRSFDMIVTANTEEECSETMRSFEEYICKKKIQQSFDSNLDPEYDKNKKVWIGLVEIYVGNDYVTEEKEEIKEAYSEWKKSLNSKAPIQKKEVEAKALVQKKKVKKIGGAIYIHRSNVDALSQEELDKVWDRLSALARSEYASALGTYEIIKIKDDSVSFIDCPDWDEADEPTVGNAYNVDASYNVKLTPMKKNNPQIYHHKWMFVADDYDGFNVEEAKAWSKKWQSIIPAGHGKYYGYKNYWDNLLMEYGLKK